MPYTMINYRTEVYTIEDDKGIPIEYNDNVAYINQQAAFFTLYYDVSYEICTKLFIRMWIWDSPEIGYIVGHKAKFTDIHKYFVNNKRAFFEHGADHLFWLE